MSRALYQVHRTVAGVHAVDEFQEVLRSCNVMMYRDAKELAMKCGIPVVPGYNDADQSPERLMQEIQRIGYPVILKASYGGGGRVASVEHVHA